MKIEGPSRTQKTSGTGKSGKADAADGSFEDFVAMGATKTASAGATRSIAMVDALLSVQGAEDPTARAARRRMQERGTNLLDGLEKIRLGLLSGNLTLGHCIDVADVVASHREKISDPALSALLDEIDLRAQVEIAKMRKALDVNG
jgi:hypothetical protein